MDSAEKKITYRKLNGICCKCAVYLRAGNVNASQCKVSAHADQFALEMLSNTHEHTLEIYIWMSNNRK